MFSAAFFWFVLGFVLGTWATIFCLAMGGASAAGDRALRDEDD